MAKSKKPEDRLIRLTELVTAIIAALAGIFLLLVGTKVIPLDIKACALITAMIALFAISVAVTAIESNRIGAFFMGAFAPPIIVEACVLCGLSYGQIYPLYIIVLPLGAMLSLIKTKYFYKAFMIFVASLGATAILFIGSLGGVKLGIVLPILIAYLGVIGAVYAAYKLIKNKEERK